MKLKLKKTALIMLALTLVIGVFAGCQQSGGQTAAPGAAAAPAAGESAAPQAPAAGGGNAQYVMKVGYGTSPGHPIDTASVEFKKLVEERSNGQIEVRLFPSAQLGSERQLIEGLQSGTVEATPTTTGPMGLFDPAYYVFDLPYIFKDSAAADAVLDGPIGDEMGKRLEEKNILCLAWWENGFRQLTNNTREVVAPQDVKGLKLRTMENEVHMEFFKGLGATPVALGFGEIYMSCKTKTVDGQENPLSIIAANKFYEVQSYCTKWDYVYSPVVFLVSKPFMESMPEDLQKVVRDTAYELRTMQRQLGRDAEAEYIKATEDGGCAVRILTDEEKAVWRAEAEKIYDKFADKIGPDLLKKVQDAGWGA